MGMQLPGELVTVLSVLGFQWPLGDEEKLFEMGQAWNSFAGTMRGETNATSQAKTVWEVNTSDTTAAFEQAWQKANSPINNLDDAATVAELVGGGLMVCAGIILALKLAVIAQLVILAIQIAQAIATAVVTFGASLLEIPIFREITRRILDALLDKAIDKVLSGAMS
jgi:hypothetical protein